MNEMQLAQRMTADEYLAQPEDGIPTWLVEGEVVVNAPGLPHQVVLIRLAAELERWVSARPGRGLASLTLDSKLDERNVFGPDVQWYADGRAPGWHAKAPHPLPETYAKRFTGKYVHRLLTGGIGHNPPQEDPKAFAQAVIDADHL